ncbi:response regulator [Natronorubrum daqingense]|uniref:response regulator n=1 Tax=Natronorubrum daqingense TaxID=588898 RepID=UPI00147D34AA|nr:response regulator [Natronorubrum daqingense]
MSHSPSTESIHILLVEDNPGDVRLIEEAFKETVTETRFHTVTDGYPALERLRDHQQDPSLPTIDLVLLDLNLPRLGGFDVLERLEDDPDLSAPPVLVLTSSETIDDISKSYDLSANAYLTKPSSPDEFAELGHAIEAFWFEQAELPPLST